MAEFVYTIRRLSKSYERAKVLDDITLAFLPGAKIGVIGHNGSGKSTLLRIMAGEDENFEGLAKPADNVKVGYVSQEPELDPSLDVRGNIEQAVKPIRDLLTRFDELNEKLAEELDADAMQKVLDELERVQNEIDLKNAWELDHTVEQAMHALATPPGDAKVESLSGGEKRRVALAQPLLAAPDVLLLDEPTNDLDVETLRSLESALLEFPGCVLIISHDRWYLDRICTHILGFEGDSRVVFFEGTYSDYAADKKARLGDDAEIPRRIKYRKLRKG
ncbi:MAG TPA: hypothetical protein DEA08_36185 [Planctomycetes bacterium]|nr:hypothetical protein [Planctomycetota bacterium]